MNWKPFLAFIVPTVFLSCTQPEQQAASTSPTRQTETQPQWEPPTAGTEVAQIKERIQQDQLNKLYVKVRIISTASSKDGLYKVLLAYGYGEQETSVQLPEWTEGVVLKPVLRKEANGNAIQLGFQAGDTTFHPYYDIKASDNAIKMSQTTAYHLTE